MSINIPNHYVQQYNTNIQLQLQQKGSKLSNTVMMGSHVGKQASPVDQIGSVEMQQVTGRFGSMPRIDAETDRRWVFPTDYDLPQLIDQFDKLRLLTDPESSYVTNAVYAAGRKRDDLIISAFFADAKTGETGGTTTSFGTTTTASGGYNVAVAHGAAAASGLTVAKLREAKKALMAAEVDVDFDPIYCAVTAEQHDNLLAEAQIISTDFNDRPVLTDGKIVRFLGINFIHTERLGTGTDDAAGTSRMVPVWAKSGMYLGNWNEIDTSISRRNDLRGEPWQAYTTMTGGATRLEEGKTIRVWCREA